MSSGQLCAAWRTASEAAVRSSKPPIPSSTQPASVIHGLSHNGRDVMCLTNVAQMTMLNGLLEFITLVKANMIKIA